MQVSNFGGTITTHVEFFIHKSNDYRFYCLTVNIPPSIHGHDHCYPQARAVIDDFGNLAIVSDWL